MKLSQFRNFIAVVEAGTFRQAAKKLNLSQSSISKSIQQLEDDLGTPMLHRGIHGVVPTDPASLLRSSPERQRLQRVGEGTADQRDGLADSWYH